MKRNAHSVTIQNSQQIIQDAKPEGIQASGPIKCTKVELKTVERFVA